MVTEWDWTRVVFDHVKIGGGDAEASKRFYGTVLAALDIPPLWESDRGAQYANLVLTVRQTRPRRARTFATKRRVSG